MSRKNVKRSWRAALIVGALLLLVLSSGSVATRIASGDASAAPSSSSPSSTQAAEKEVGVEPSAIMIVHEDGTIEVKPYKKGQATSGEVDHHQSEDTGEITLPYAVFDDGQIRSVDPMLDAFELGLTGEPRYQSVDPMLEVDMPESETDMGFIQSIDPLLEADGHEVLTGRGRTGDPMLIDDGLYFESPQQDAVDPKRTSVSSLVPRDGLSAWLERKERLRREKETFIANRSPVSLERDVQGTEIDPKPPTSFFDSMAFPYSGGVEDFEGVFPAGFWFVGDNDSTNGADYWDDVSCFSQEGSWSAWCADIGTTSDCTSYDSYMNSYMYVECDYFGLSGGADRMYHWRWIDLEECCDEFLYVLEGYVTEPPHGGGTPDVTAVYGPYGNSAGWINRSTIIPATFDTMWYVRVTFWFNSDFSIVGPGAYLDYIEFNNRADTALYPIDGGFADYPDLVVNTFSAACNSSTGLLDVSVEVCNIGSEVAGSSEVGIYASTNNIISTGDCLIGLGGVTSLGPGGCQTLPGSLSATQCTPGTYYIGAYADHLFQVTESDEGNNTYVDGQEYIPCPTEPDLVTNNCVAVCNFTSTLLDVSNDICNIGTGDAGSFYSGVYASTNDIISTADCLLADAFVSSLAAGACTTATGSINSAACGTGTFYIGFYVDYTRVVAEVNENNNTCVVGQRTLPCITLDPDLVVSTCTALCNPATSLVDVSVDVCNIGTAIAGSSEVGIYASLNNIISTGDCLIGTGATTSLAPGACLTQTGSLSGAACTPGTYYIGAYADHLFQVTESDENNNTCVDRQLDLPCLPPPDPDLIVNTCSAICNPATGLVDVSYEVCNIGIAPAGAFETGVYASTNSVISTSDCQIGQGFLPSLAPGACQTQSGSLSGAACAPGTYYIGAYADHLFQVTESNENNNTCVDRQLDLPCQTAPDPDLIVNPCSAVCNPTTGLLDVSYTVCNIGLAPAGPFETGVYASTDSIISTSDCQIGQGTLSSLAPGACQTQSGSLSGASCTPGTYYIGAYADHLGQVTEANENNNTCVDGQWDLPCPTGGDIYIPTDIEGSPGGLIDVPVYVNNVTDMVGYFFRVTFNTSILSYQSATNGSLTSGWPSPTVNVVGNELRVGNFSAVPTSGTGTIVVLRFLGVGASGQCSSMQFQEATINDIPVSTTDGLVCLTQQFRWGDLGSAPPNEDCDDIVGMVDASLIMQVLVGIRDRFPCYTSDVGCVMPADLNGDGVCGAVDASLIAQWVVGLISCFPADGNCDGFGPDPIPLPGGGQADAGSLSSVLRDVSPASTAEGHRRSMVTGLNSDNRHISIPLPESDKSLSLPVLEGDAGTCFDVDVTIDDADGLLGYFLDITYDPAVVEPLDPVFDATGTLTESWPPPVPNVEPGRIRLGGFAFSPLGPGGGTLIKLRLCLVATAQACDTSDLVWGSATTLNDLTLLPENLTNGSMTVTCTQRPADLTAGDCLATCLTAMGPAGSGTGSTLGLLAAGDLDLSVNVFNNGETDASAFDVYFLASDDDTIDLGDCMLYSERVTGGLTAGAMTSISTSLTDGGAACAGSKVIGVYVDASAEVPEFDENNNTCANGRLDLPCASGPGDQSLSLPAITGCPDDCFVDVPVTINDADGLVGYFLDITFDPNVVEVMDPVFDTAGTLTAGCVPPTANVEPGRIRLGTFCTTPLGPGGGTLVKLRLCLNSAAQDGDTSALHFEATTTINDVPVDPALLTDGSMTVECAPQLPDLEACVCSGTCNNGHLDLSTQVCNNGSGDAAAFDVYFFASDDPNIDLGDCLLYFERVTSLAAGASTTISTSISDGGLSCAGLKYIGVYVDASSEVEETNEANNTCSDGQLDLPCATETEKALSLPAIEGCPGDCFVEVPVTINDADGLVGYFLDITFDPNVVEVMDPVFSTSGTLTAGCVPPTANVEPGRIRLGTFCTTALGPGGGTLVNLRLCLNSSAQDGDSSALHFEATTTLNDVPVDPANLTDGSMAVVCAPESPDLEACVCSGTCNNGVLDLSTQVCNNGVGDATAFDVYFMASDDAIIDAGDCMLYSERVTSLAAGASTTISTSLADGGAACPGLKYIGVLVDPSNEVDESEEGNNTCSDGQLTLPCDAPPDVRTLSLPAIEGCPDDCFVDVPVTINDADGLVGYFLDITYDPTVVEPMDPVFDTTGTLTEGCVPPTANVVPGRIRLGTFCTTPLGPGGGTLVKLRLCLSSSAQEGDTSALHFESTTTLNDIPVSPGNLTDGSMTVEDDCGGDGMPYLDIKPGSCPNPLNPKSQGKGPVALVGTSDFDVHDVLFNTLRLSRVDGVGGSVAPLLMGGNRPKFDDVATPFMGELCGCHEYEGDGIVDLKLKFFTPDVVSALRLRGLSHGTMVELTLTGTLNDGTTFAANDCIRIVGNGPGSD